MSVYGEVQEMDYIKEIDKMREELVRILNRRCDDLILQ